MRKLYQVITSRWAINGYDLKKGDILEVVDRNEHEVCVLNSYMNCSQWVRSEDFNTHCQAVN